MIALFAVLLASAALAVEVESDTSVSTGASLGTNRGVTGLYALGRVEPGLLLKAEDGSDRAGFVRASLYGDRNLFNGFAGWGACLAGGYGADGERYRWLVGPTFFYNRHGKPWSYEYLLEPSFGLSVAGRVAYGATDALWFAGEVEAGWAFAKGRQDLGLGVLHEIRLAGETSLTMGTLSLVFRFEPWWHGDGLLQTSAVLVRFAL